MIRPKKQLRAELYIAGDHAKRLLAALHDNREQIEAEFGEALAWEELPANATVASRRISWTLILMMRRIGCGSINGLLSA